MVKFCPNCGKEVTEGSQVCLGCGKLLTEEKPTQVNANPNAKSKLAGGLLGIFLGSIGIHNFYLGYTGKAVAQLLIAVLTCGIGTIITGPWGLIEGILILTGSINVDGNGEPLKD